MSGGSMAVVIAGVAQLVERKPSKLDVAGSSPVSRLRGTGNREWGTETRSGGERRRDWIRERQFGSRFPDPQFPGLLA